MLQIGKLTMDEIADYYADLSVEEIMEIKKNCSGQQQSRNLK